MDSRTTSPATPSRSTSITSDASWEQPSSPTSRDADIASTSPASGERPWSLRRRLVIAVAGAACVVFLILGMLMYRAVAVRTTQQFDQMLQRQAAIALTYAEHEYGEGESVVPEAFSAAPQPMPYDSVYQITTRAREVLYRSPGAPQAVLADDDALGYADVQAEGSWWRVYSLSSGATPLVIHMASRLQYREALLGQVL